MLRHRVSVLGVAIVAAATLVACGDDAAPPDSAATGASNPDLNARGALVTAVGESVTRPDGAYAITITGFSERAADECTAPPGHTRAADGIRLVAAHLRIETSADAPAGTRAASPADFYAVSSQGTVRPDIAAAGTYACAGDTRDDAATPAPGTTVERVDTFMVPVDAVGLGYREPGDAPGFAVEWPLDAVAPASAQTAPPTSTGSAPAPSPTGAASSGAPPAPPGPNPVDRQPNPYPQSRNSDGQPSGQGGGTLTACPGLTEQQPGTGIYTRPDGSTYFDYAAPCLVGGSMR